MSVRLVFLLTILLTACTEVGHLHKPEVPVVFTPTHEQESSPEFWDGLVDGLDILREHGLDVTLVVMDAVEGGEGWNPRAVELEPLPWIQLIGVRSFVDPVWLGYGGIRHCTSYAAIRLESRAEHIAHEIVHALGALEHVDAPGNLMSPAATGEGLTREQLDEIDEHIGWRKDNCMW